MNCPIDASELRITERQGIEIDYCPKCRGVWLDRGELDKLIERTAAPVPGRVERDEDDRYRPDDRDRGYPSPERGTYDRDEYRRPKSKRRSLLEDLFDFD